MRVRYQQLLVLCAAIALAIIAPLLASGDRADVAVLKKVASRVTDRTGVITIEASDPVPYVASQPDPHTFVVELRDVVAVGFADGFTTDPRHTVSAVQVETGQAFDGATVARIRMTLSQATRPRVRSSRNVIYVETDRLDRVSAGSVSTAGPASAIRDLRVTKRGEATAITFRGTGRLMPSGIEEPKDGAPRLIIDLPNSTSALPNVTPVAQGPVDKVRIGLNEKSPLVTRLTLELTRKSPYRIESSIDGQDLTVVFDSPSPPSAASAEQARLVAQAVPAGQAPPTLTGLRPVLAQAQAPAPPTQVGPAAPQVPAGQQSTVTQPTAAQGQPTRYTGVPVSLDFQGADLRAVLRTFAEISGLNIVIDPTIQGTVDVALRDVPWDQALDIILRANKLGYSVDGTIVRIAPLAVLADEETQRRKLAEEQALSGELQVLTRSLSYARAEDLRALITATVLSQRGSIQTDVRTNTLIINDLPDRLQRANALLTTLDRPEPQVEIEARIVQTNRNFARVLGVQWGVGARAASALGNTLPLAFPNQASINGRASGVQSTPLDPADQVGSIVNLGVNAATTGIGLALGSINGAVNLDVALSALEQQGQGRILSTPRVSTQNNVEAEITQGVQIPIQTVANNTVTVTFKDAALTLKVTPQITAANTIIMRINLENASPDFSRSVNNIPPIDTQRAVTQVLVSNGDTTVIGGIYVSREQAISDRTPGLYRLPLLGWLFKRDNVTDESRELLIFITPRIISL